MQRPTLAVRWIVFAKHSRNTLTVIRWQKTPSRLLLKLRPSLVSMQEHSVLEKLHWVWKNIWSEALHRQDPGRCEAGRHHSWQACKSLPGCCWAYDIERFVPTMQGFCHYPAGHSQWRGQSSQPTQTQGCFPGNGESIWSCQQGGWGQASFLGEYWTNTWPLGC